MGSPGPMPVRTRKAQSPLIPWPHSSQGPPLPVTGRKTSTCHQPRVKGEVPAPSRKATLPQKEITHSLAVRTVDPSAGAVARVVGRDADGWTWMLTLTWKPAWQGPWRRHVSATLVALGSLGKAGMHLVR
jgi:hypothetical protein